MGDEWSGFADLLANLIEKYADELDIDNLPEPPKIKKSKEFNSFAFLTASFMERPLANSAVITAEKVQPVP